MRKKLKMSGYGTTKTIPDINIIYIERGGSRKFASVALIFTDHAVHFSDEVTQGVLANFNRLTATFGATTLKMKQAGSLGNLALIEFGRPVANLQTIRLCIHGVLTKGKFVLADESLITWVSEETADLLASHIRR